MASTVTMNSGHMTQILDTATAKYMTPERMTRVLASGIIAYAMDEDAKIDNRLGIRAALGLHMRLKSPLHAKSDASEKHPAEEFYAQLFSFSINKEEMLTKESIGVLMAVADLERPWQLGCARHLTALMNLLPCWSTPVTYAALGDEWIREPAGDVCRTDLCMQPNGERHWIGTSLHHTQALRAAYPTYGYCYIGVRPAA